MQKFLIFLAEKREKEKIKKCSNPYFMLHGRPFVMKLMDFTS